jgi:hypothetical protein
VIVKELSRNFENAGFRLGKAASEFRHTSQSGDTVAVALGLLPASKRGYYKAAVTAHIRINAIEEVYAAFQPQQRPRDRNTHYTISVNCDNIYRDKSVSQSFELLSNEAVRAMAERLWKAILDDVLPFLERYCNRERLVANLEADNYITWVTSDRMTRYCVLMSDRVLAGDEVGFEKYAAEFLAYCEKPYGQMYRQVANAIVTGVRERYFEKIT